MDVDPDSGPVLALFLVGMAIPILGAAVGHEVLALYISGSEFIYVSGVGFLIVTWTFLELVAPDRRTVVSLALVIPWVFVLGVAGLILATGTEMGRSYLFHGIGDLGEYAGSFMVAGILALVLRDRVERVSGRYRVVPQSRTLAVGILLFAIVALVVGGGVLTAGAMSTSVTDVEPGVVDHYSPVLNVSLEGQPAELRLRVTGPDGNTYTKRITGSRMDGTRSTNDGTRSATDGGLTVPVELYQLDIYPKAGTYRVDVLAITGLRVDSATYTVERPPTPVVLDVETAGPGEPLDLGLPPNATVYRPSPGPTDPDTRVAVVVRNEGDIAAPFDTMVYLAPDLVDGRDIFIEPGQQGGNIIAISEEHVGAIRERTNGTVTVEVVYADTRIRRQARLPEQSSST